MTISESEVTSRNWSRTMKLREPQPIIKVYDFGSKEFYIEVVTIRWAWTPEHGWIFNGLDASGPQAVKAGKSAKSTLDRTYYRTEKVPDELAALVEAERPQEGF